MTDNARPAGYHFDTDELADYLNLSPRTLDQWAWEKINIPYALIGRKRWYRQSDADHYLFRRQVKVTPPKAPKRMGVGA